MSAFHSVEAEYAVIAAIVASPEVIDTLGLVPDDFFDAACRETFATVFRMVEGGCAVDPILISEALPVGGAARTAGGLAWISEIVINTPVSDSLVGQYAGVIQRFSKSRRLAAVGGEISAIATNRMLTPEQKVAQADEMIAALGAETTQAQALGVREALQIHMTTLQDRENAGIPGIPTGYDEFDELVGGLLPKNLYILGARPSMGKTSLAMCIGAACAGVQKSAVAEGDHGVLVLSQEMPTAGLIDRMLAAHGSIDLGRLLRGALTDDDYTRMGAAIGKLYDRPLWIDDKPALTLSDVRASVRKHKKLGLRLVVIDYIQLMQGPGDSRNAQIEAISRGLKQIAKDFDVAVLALSQLSRKLEERSDKRPTCADLRDSGGIEQDADGILFVYRDEVYRPDTPDKGVAEIIVAKNRNGPLGVVRMLFRGEYTRFDPMPRGYHGN